MNCNNKSRNNCLNIDNINFKSLDKLIEYYIRFNKEILDSDINYYKNLDFDKVINYSVSGKKDCRNKHFHQYRLKNNIIESVTKILIKIKK